MTREEMDRLAELHRAIAGGVNWSSLTMAEWERAIYAATPALLAAAREAEELRAWQREAAAELRAVNQGFTANRALVRALLARVKP